MAKQGRKLLLNNEMIQKIATAFGYGNYGTVVADYVGVHPTTLGQWIRRGEELSGKDEGELDNDERLFVELYNEVRKARSMSEMRAVERIRQAGERDWKANAWFLERTATSRWGRTERLELTGAEGGAIEVSAEAVERKLEALLANHASALEQGTIDAEVLEPADSSSLLEDVISAIGVHASDEPDEPTDDSSEV